MIGVFHLEVQKGGGDTDQTLETLVNRAIAEGIRKLHYEGVYLEYELKPVITDLTED
jgi:hypothetical protein